MSTNIIEGWGKKTLKNAIRYSLASIISQILMVVYSVLLMRWLSSQNYGIFSAHYAVLILLSMLMNWGISEWLVKEILTFGKPHELTGGVLRFKIIVGLFWVMILSIIIPNINPGFYQAPLILIVALDVLLESCFTTLLASLAGQEKFSLAGSLLIISRMLRLALLLLLILFAIDSLVSIFLVRLVSTIVISLITVSLVKPRYVIGTSPNILQIFIRSFAFNVYEMVYLIFLQIDLNLIVWFVGDANQIGPYAFLTTVINMIVTIPMAINSILLPGLIRSYKNNPELFRNRIGYILFFFLGLGIGLWVLITVPGTMWVSDVLGRDYEMGARLLFMAAPILLIRVLNQVNNVYLISVGLELKRLLPLALATTIKFIAGIFIVIQWKAMGLVILSIIVDGLLLVWNSCVSLRHFFLKRNSQNL